MRKRPGRRARFERQKYLCSASEMRFFRELEAAVPEFSVMMKVRAAALLRPVGGSDAERHRYSRKVSQKEFDFVLVKQSYVVAAVELDDRTHELPERRARDGFLDGACRRARLPLIRFRVAREYGREQIRGALLSALAGDVQLRQNTAECEGVRGRTILSGWRARQPGSGACNVLQEAFLWSVRRAAAEE